MPVFCQMFLVAVAAFMAGLFCGPQSIFVILVMSAAMLYLIWWHERYAEMHAYEAAYCKALILLAAVVSTGSGMMWRRDISHDMSVIWNVFTLGIVIYIGVLLRRSAAKGS